jgi:KaiC/GvpD/RAD55 family RecA-like ATPase
MPAYEALTGRIATGTKELDRLLPGGIPQEYAVILAAHSTDEREQLTKNFLETGALAGETTFHITSEAANTKKLAEKYPLNFYLFLCNPQADTLLQNAPNVYKLKGVENLTEIDIALTKALRKIDSSSAGPRRFCVSIVSEVLLQHHALVTRKWFSALLPTLKSKGFTILAVIDPQIHPPEELQSIIGIFDGEIRVVEKETPEGVRQMLRIRKLLNQKYLENEIILAKEKLS